MSMGAKRFLQYYLFCGIVGGLLTAFLDPSPVSVVGASGALSGLLVALALYFPNLRMSLMFLIPMRAITLAWGFGIFSAAFVLLNLVNPSSGVGGNISHFGHLAGMVAALIFFYIRPYVPFLR
jgi:membrane associated rhomboid family serine protease